MSTLQNKIADFQIRRARYGPLPQGTALVISSTNFTSNADINHQPSSPSLEGRFSRESQARQKSTLKASTKVPTPSSSSTTISLGTARPASMYFPWEKLSITAQDPRARTGRSTMECVPQEEGFDLDIAMNYGFAAGSPQLLRFVTEHVELVHEPPYRDWNTSLTCGTTSALDIVLRMLCDRGQSVAVEEWTYSGMIEAARPLGIELVGVRMDEDGLVPEHLDEVLRTWDRRKGPKPTVLYTIPSGQNPTGVTQTKERRESIYAVAERHDILIIEDDPYYFLQLGKAASTPDEYLVSLPPSYLSLDRSNRVIRLDTTSKIISPGLRCGWITGPSAFISKFQSFTEFSTVSPSGPSQILLYKLLDETWGHEGFLTWLMQLSQRYSGARDTLIGACRSHLPPDLCRWLIPSCGMFVWIRIDWRKVQMYRASCGGTGTVADDDSATTMTTTTTMKKKKKTMMEERIYARSKECGVQVSKGSWFAVDRGRDAEQAAFRLTFATSCEETLDEAVKRFGKAASEELGWSSSLYACSDKMVMGADFSCN